MENFQVQRCHFLKSFFFLSCPRLQLFDSPFRAAFLTPPLAVYFGRQSVQCRQEIVRAMHEYRARDLDCFDGVEIIK